MTEAILLTDGYKLDHRRQYPKGTERVYSNWTPRSCGYFPEAKEGAVVFGIQYFIKEYLINQMNANFFQKPKDQAVAEFAHRVNTFLGPDNQVGVEHIVALHDLGYLPIEIKALPEGSLCPIRVPALTFINTKDEFFWLTNYFETITSTTLWLPMTSATSARLYKQELLRHAKKTGFLDQPGLDFLCHDFSMRGMAGVEAAIMSGMGHLTSFTGSETIPAISALERYYGASAENGVIAGTVPATEHSVMCAGGKLDEFGTFKRLITDVYPEGFVSIVSDTWDFWQVMTNYLPRLKDEIMTRNGRVVIRPDSGDPVHIICGYTFDDYENFQEEAMHSTAVQKGAYEILWDIFGGTINEAGYKVLDPHIGMIYGDSITLERQKEIYRRLEEKGFAASNLVLGVGSFTYQFKSRDSLGFAMKATWCQVNGEAREIFKDPITDNGTKKSLKGLICVKKNEAGQFYAIDQVSAEEEKTGELKTVFKDGKLIKDWTLDEIRNNVNSTINV
ncbi:MAG: nicotinate phosphoribosyltransferase [Muribaculaceae bacterium]|nr:nicotinate phosphoribosyltransferase [Muribaculaceae bacterium]